MFFYTFPISKDNFTHASKSVFPQSQPKPSLPHLMNLNKLLLKMGLAEYFMYTPRISPCLSVEEAEDDLVAEEDE